MGDIWEYGLVPFESEEDICKAENMYLENNNYDLRNMMLLDKTIKQDVISALYSEVKPWIPFADCGCEPQKLYAILRCNALICALATFSRLDKRNDSAVSDLVSQELEAGEIKSIWDETLEYKWSKSRLDYLSHYLHHIAYKDKERIQIGKKKRVRRVIKTSPVFAPIAETILLRKSREFENSEKVDKLFWTLVKVYATYAPDGRLVRMGYSKTENPPSIPAATERQQRHRLCAAYEQFYNVWMGIPLSSVKNKCDEDTYISVFLQELVFHHRALSRSERALENVAARRKYESKITLDVNSAVDDIAQTLYCTCRIPLVFGAEKLQFRKREKTDYFFGQYLDFIKLAIIRFYEQANHDVEGVCREIKKLLKNPDFKELFKENGENTKRCTTDLSERNLTEIAAAAVEGIFQPDYYGKNSMSYALSPDEHFSIVTETSQEKKNPVRTVRKNGKLKIEVDPDQVEPDISVAIARFKSKEIRDVFLSDLDAAERILANAINASSDQVILIELEAEDNKAH